MPALLIPILLALFAEYAPSLGRLLVNAFNSVAGGPAPPTMMEELTQLATWRVQNMTLSTAPPADKRAMVLVNLQEDCKRKAFVVETSALNLLIEIAYNGLKATLPPDVAAATTK